jgi:hypothetical protein
MKTWVRVELSTVVEVEIEVEHEEGDEPTDLTAEEKELAKSLADNEYTQNWDILSVSELK